MLNPNTCLKEVLWGKGRVYLPFGNFEVWRIMKKMNTGKQIPRNAFLFILF